MTRSSVSSASSRFRGQPASGRDRGNLEFMRGVAEDLKARAAWTGDGSRRGAPQSELASLYCGRGHESKVFLKRLDADSGSRPRVHTDLQSGLSDFGSPFAEPGESDLRLRTCPFLDAIMRSTEAWPKGSVHFERFGPSSSPQGTDIELARTGRALTGRRISRSWTCCASTAFPRSPPAVAASGCTSRLAAGWRDRGPGLHPHRRAR